MLPQSSVQWDQITLTHPRHRLKSRGGSLTSQTGTPEDRLPKGAEEDHRRTLQDHLQGVGVVEEEVVVEAVEAVVEAVEEAVEEHSHYLDTHLPNQLKNS